MQKAIVVGAGGQVARELLRGLAARGVPVAKTSSSGREGSYPLNLADTRSIENFFSAIRREWGEGGVEVFLPGALTHVDRCEQEPELCRKTNTDGPIAIAKICRSAGYSLTYFSSEYVFGNDEYQGGQTGPFQESDSVAPTCLYGKSKCDSETAVTEILAGKALIVRTTMIFSWDPPAGMNFLMQYLRHLDAIRAAGKAEKVFRIPVDQISTPAYAPALADATLALREKLQAGIFHLVGPDLLSREELVRKVIDAFGYDRDLSLSGFQFLTTKELKQAARRPLTAGLLNLRGAELGVELPSLAEAFADVSRRMHSQKD